MAEILHQLRLVVCPIICKVLYIPGGAGLLPSTAGQFFGVYVISPDHISEVYDQLDPETLGHRFKKPAKIL